ncbi:putative membrane protein [Aciduliprofundum sp. MAR08-339]|uniref:tripartite tricarboxylate transporter permease n=1 Tax=Aciduliprofundum sp. (strain MAR08-339) TaxID=673860 RepID=UPI0002A47B1F|nr:putative membrane protein [Aciduliprofundum sp. MAR08-339]
MSITFLLLCIAFVLLGALIGSALSMLPGLHVYNVIGFFLLFYFSASFVLNSMLMVLMLIGMLVTYAFVFTIPSIYFSAPDDSTMFVLMPSLRYLKEGRGHEAVVLIATGALTGLLAIVFFVPLLMGPLSIVWNIVSNHLHWIIGAVIAYMLLSEFPKDFGRHKNPLHGLKEGWKTIMAGYLTFFLSSILGIISFNKTIVPANHAFQSLMAPLIGLFATSSIILNLISKYDIPEQNIPKSVDAKPVELLHGAVAGSSGGLFAAFLPAVTAGVGGYMASHGFAQKGDKSFLVSMGASRVVYYVGAISLFFLPVLHIRRGALAMGINLFFTPESVQQFYLVDMGIAIAGLYAFFVVIFASRFLAKRIYKINPKVLNLVVLGIVVSIVFFMTSWQGLLIMSVATAIGLIPVLFNSRRSHCLAVILVPIWLNMSGIALGGLFGLW